MEKKYYIYAHINAVKNEIFYIGKGYGKRAFIKSNRSSIWKRTVKKYNYVIDILEDNLTEEEAFEREKFYIAKIGRRDLGKGTLINFTNGGEGSSGMIISEETRKKKSEASKGRKNSEETINRMKIAQQNRSDETKQKMSKSMKGRKFSDETKQKLSEAKKGKSPWNKGIKGCGKGRITSEETKQKQREAALNRINSKRF